MTVKLSNILSLFNSTSKLRLKKEYQTIFYHNKYLLTELQYRTICIPEPEIE